jgi:3-hydroxy-9,10-secoandrosta-1,3,5(10)-triene-9,17-dione monooxygenase
MTGEQYLQRVRELIPAIRERAAETERLRRLPDQTWAELREAGALRALQPRRWGGLELDPQVFYQAAMEVAAACPSTGWVLSVVGVHPWQIALFPDQAQADIWDKDPATAASSSYLPTGSVQRVAGGYRLGGRWSFSSGCDHCQWVLLGGLVPGASEKDQPDFLTFAVPRADYQIEDNWHVAGLAGTGSKNILIQDAFVPDHRTHRMIDAFMLESPGNAVNTGPIYRLPHAAVFSTTIAAPAVGAAQGALDTYRRLLLSDKRNPGGTRLGDEPFARMNLAVATSKIDAGRQRMLANFDEMLALVRAGQPLSIEQRARVRWDVTHIIQTSVEAVNLLFHSSGGHGLFLDNPMQRFFRDANAMRVHGIVAPEISSRLFAEATLGRDFDWTRWTNSYI